ncbi:uncharacterized protein LOC131858286 [Cryptomeria japonica]|uniref:uncharacterized protein LOC131858286 n=1 Tax=Cryptomeria japonica TaxID=3369 RepID=UPI0027DA1F6F|nr:uncharacterized protein LOC131858286 [Cryptomeria japonica]
MKDTSNFVADVKKGLIGFEHMSGIAERMKESKTRQQSVAHVSPVITSSETESDKVAKFKRVERKKRKSSPTPTPSPKRTRALRKKQQAMREPSIQRKKLTQKKLIPKTQKEIDDIADNLIGSSELTSVLDQEMAVYEEKIENIEKEKARLKLKARELKKKLGVTYERKKKNERSIDTKAKKKPNKDEKEEDNSDTQSNVVIKEVKRSGRNVAPIFDELVHGIKEYGGLVGVGRKYPLCNEEDKRKIEDALIWNLHNLCRTPYELHEVIPSDLQNLIEGRWKIALAIEKEHRIKALMEVQNELDYNQANLVAEACVQHFKIRNRIGRVSIKDIQGMHDEGVDMWKMILSQQKEDDEEIEKEVKQGQDIATQEKRKGKDKDTTDGFDEFSVEDIIGYVVSDIPNLTKDAEPSVDQKSTVETIDIDDTLAKDFLAV